MLENQFIKIESSTANWGGDAFPIIYAPNVPTAIRTNRIFIRGYAASITAATQDGRSMTVNISSSGQGYQTCNLNSVLSEGGGVIFEDGDRIIFSIADSNNSQKLYSNVCVLKKFTSTSAPDGFSYVKYRCGEDAFGFPFSMSSSAVALYLPILLHSPQNVQDDKTYEKANGDVVTLYAKYYKEWSGETEYVSEAMHDKIIAALSCDEVYINNVRVTKSDNYQIDWDNYDLDCDGVTKLARATFKVRENITQRNSNY